ncbi:Non-lysosomal glucosylceramidase [Chamberlinius hualienensis]
MDPTDVSKYGWKVKLNHTFDEKRNQNIFPRISQLPAFILFGIRYLAFYIGIRLKRRKPFIDGIKTLGLKQIYGVPLGGIGSGTIGRGFKGEFCRFQLFPGIYKHHIVKSDAFIASVRKEGKTVYQQVLSTRNCKKSLSAWRWAFPGGDASYTGLFPRSWTVYELKELKIQLVCRQISPVIPHNYKDSCFPVSVFVWDVINNSDDEVEVSITLAFKNGSGGKGDAAGGFWNEPFTYTDGSTLVRGINMHQKIRGWKCCIGIAGIEKEGVDITHLNYFNPKGSGEELWTDLLDDGRLNVSNELSQVTEKGQQTASAVCAKVSVPANQKSQLELCLAWDMPQFSFRSNPDMIFTRRYCRWFGKDGKNIPQLTFYAATNYLDWERQIDEWQEPILENDNYPDWYKSAIFNELYFVADGGSVWVEKLKVSDEQAVEGDVREEYGHFAYLEGHEYRMFNTYDVHFYASFALTCNWPKLQLSLQYDMAEFVLSENRERLSYISGQKGRRKVADVVPHDIGDPDDGPWVIVNGYMAQDTSGWRDLNVKFVLQVYRDFIVTKDENYLKAMWPVVKVLMEKTLTFDKDKDGLIENSGKCDQTYDTWVMTGPSAYCGGLWLAALLVAQKMAHHLGFTEKAQEFEELLEKGKEAFHQQLWTGSYYKFDTSSNYGSDSIMADQLCGHWYLRSCGLNYEVFPKQNVMSAIDTIFKCNVMGFHGGQMGAINSCRPSGKIDRTTVQSEEMWTGVTYALAALMIHEGEQSNGFKTAEGVYRSCFERLGMAYQTPEALHEQNHYRSLGYMRPLCIWSMQHAIEQLQKQK